MDPEYGSQYSAGDIGFVLICMALVWLMIPGIGYFYSGMARSKNALSLIMCCLMSLVVVTVQWFIWGYSLTFSKTASVFIGNMDNALFRNVLGDPSIGSDKIPDIVFAIFQCMFAALTPALAIGSAAERARLLPMMIFIFIWSTIVYDPIACWTWNPNGWSAKLGGLDFAGGTPVHISSGFASLAYAIILGKRRGHGSITGGEDFKPHNMSNVVLGTAFLWFGWFGFNGGSALAGNMRAAMACVVTNLAAAVGAITWLIMDYRIERKFSALGFCSGAVAGLVAITPASGFVGPGPAVAIGFLGGFFCNLAVHLKHLLKFDDAVDVFAVHGVGGYVGSVLTGLFAEQYIAGLDGVTEIEGGWMNHNWVQLGHQFADATAGAAWSFCITYLILFVMDRIPGLSLRVDPEVELQGLDAAEIGEMAYYHVDKVVTVDPQSGEQKIVSEHIREVRGNENAQGDLSPEKIVAPSQFNNV
ncbi:ammonium transporter AmtB-like domain-containing protein [Zychaea mexicana]|uniref:ammonium transporter AmtB-like domain-containing protein n=1 Tax=Zychaea mexicana TaxID=64656 RepID=UPI0022FF30C3|nr:ammonium transporter AmtB-like domain-containing protein [Zychaea mexicana]KAI9497079.1 ammonium transporter AmtB-like domain-containing protein [Zychaea mexicana]